MEGRRVYDRRCSALGLHATPRAHFLVYGPDETPDPGSMGITYQYFPCCKTAVRVLKLSGSKLEQDSTLGHCLALPFPLPLFEDLEEEFIML